MTDLRTRLQEAWTEDHGRPPTWVEELLLDHYAENMEAEMDRIIGDVTDWKPISILAALEATPTVLPRRRETVEERVTRKHVPLVRAAAAEVPMGDVSGLRVDPDLARFRCFVPAGRLHAADLPCWCGGFTTAFGNVHLDERIPRSSNGFAGFAFSSSELPRGWFS